MKKLMLLALLLVPLWARAFTLIGLAFTPAPHMVWFEAQSPGTGAAPEGTDFTPRFIPYGAWGLDGGGIFYGLDLYEFDTITCGWSAAGTVSGGTDLMRMQLIQKSDAGVLCTCDLPGACNDAAGSEHTCSCGAVRPAYAVGSAALSAGYAMQLSTATNCGGNPQVIRCGIPFRR